MYSDRKENRISPAYIAARICDYFSSWKIYPKDVTVIIMGKPGPTGKTWLCDHLKEMGFNAIELDLEGCRAHVEYHEETNRYTIAAKTVYVVLNDILPQYRDTDDVESLYPKTLTADEHKAYMRHIKTKMNSIYDTGNYCYGMTGGYTIPPLSRANSESRKLPQIKNVIFNDPATIVFWKDGTKTVVKAQDGEDYDDEKGLAMAISKKALGNKGNYYNTFDKFLIRPEEEDIPQISFEEAVKRASNNFVQISKDAFSTVKHLSSNWHKAYIADDDQTTLTCKKCGHTIFYDGELKSDIHFPCPSCIDLKSDNK
jgi:predicted nucleic-acid-binding Zn-ribbon protein